MSEAPTCPVCGAGHSPSDTTCQACGARLDTLLVDLSATPDPVQTTAETPPRTREVVTVVVVLVAMAVGAGFLFASGEDSPSGSKAAPTTGFEQAAPVPEPTVALPSTPTPIEGDVTPEAAETAALTELAPLLGQLSGRSLAWRDDRAVVILDLDTGVESSVELGGSGFDGQMAVVGRQILTRSGNRLVAIAPDGTSVEWTAEGGIDQFFGGPGDDGFWVTRYPTSEQAAPEVAYLEVATLGRVDPEWRELPRFAYASGASSQGLIVSLWQGRPFLFRPDGTVEQLPVDGVLSAVGDHVLTFSCVGGVTLTCPATLVDHGAGTERVVAVETTDPWAFQIAPGGEQVYWVDWGTFPAEHHVRDLGSGEDVTVGQELDGFDEPMRFSTDGEWLVGALPDEVILYRIADGLELSLPVVIPHRNGVQEMVMFSVAEPA